MRVPAHKAGSVRKLFDFQCGSCNKKFESMARQSEIDNKEILCPDCQTPATKLISAVGVDSQAAASWRR